MASVWWATHELLNRDVALKVSPVGRDEQVVARFVREARIIGKFQHPNIVGVVDAGLLQEEGYLFLAMELLRGMPFADGLIPNRPLPPREVLPILIGVCRGLEVAHAAGVVHRDMKPENIFLAKVPGEGVVPKIVDFGISQMEEARDAITFDGQILGTPSYMSPEQARGERNIDARADLWAIGVILHEALSGRQPFRAESHHAVLHRILESEPTRMPESVHPALRAIVARCLQKDRTLRYPDAAMLRADLEAALAGCCEENAGPVVLPSMLVPARREVRASATTGAMPGAHLGDVAVARSSKSEQALALLADLSRAAAHRLSVVLSGIPGSSREATLACAAEPRPPVVRSRSWTALGFAGGVTAMAAIVASMMHSEPAAATTRGEPISDAVDEAPAMVAGLGEASRRARDAALTSFVVAVPEGCTGAAAAAGSKACAGARARAESPVAALPGGEVKEAEVQGGTPEGPGATTTQAVEDRSSQGPRRRRHGITSPGF